MTAAPPLRFSFPDYLRVEADSAVPHDHLDGLILAIPPSSPRHAALTAALTLALGQQLTPHRHRLFSRSLRLRVPATGFTTHPDLSIAGAPLDLDPEDANTLTNPVLVLDILTPSTEPYIRDIKLPHYQQLASLWHIVLVASDAPRIEVWTRQANTWTSTSAGPGERAELSRLGCTLDVDEIYRDPFAA